MQQDNIKLYNDFASYVNSDAYKALEAYIETQIECERDSLEEKEDITHIYKSQGVISGLRWVTENIQMARNLKGRKEQQNG